VIDLPHLIIHRVRGIPSNSPTSLYVFYQKNN
jgi:hypothetical protein